MAVPNHPQTQPPRMIKISYFKFSMDHELDSSLTGWLWLRLSNEPANKIPAMGGYFKSWLEDSVFLDVGRSFQFIQVVGGLRRTSGFTHGGLSTELLHGRASPRPSNLRESKKERPTWKPPYFFNLIFEVGIHHLCHILFTRSESLSPANIQVAIITQGCQY